jgi:regulator of replication initiation timing
VVASVGSAINPAIANLSGLIEKQIGEQLRQAHAQRREDAAKIAQLTDTVHTCLETIQSMVTTQADLQLQISKLQQSLDQPAPQAPVRSPPAARTPVKQKTPEELETEDITRLMADGNYEQGTMQWLQSRRTTELFEEVFIRCNPGYLRQVSPLLALSTGAVVSADLDRNTPERLVWLDAVLTSVNPNVSLCKFPLPSSADYFTGRRYS